jgi:hypothetical protein
MVGRTYGIVAHGEESALGGGVGTGIPNEGADPHDWFVRLIHKEILPPLAKCRPKDLQILGIWPNFDA